MFTAGVVRGRVVGEVLASVRGGPALSKGGVTGFQAATKVTAKAPDVGNADRLAVLDSTTPTGSLVSHGRQSTAIGSDSATMTNFGRATDTGYGHNVIVHGSRPDYDEFGGLFWVDGNPTNPQQIVEAVLSNPSYRPGSPICLARAGRVQMALLSRWQIDLRPRLRPLVDRWHSTRSLANGNKLMMPG
jgi:hypothetical protein